MRTWILLTAAAALIGLLGAALLGPRPPALSDVPASTDTGDRALAQQVRAVLGDQRGRRGVAVAVVDPEGAVRFAGVGRSGDPARPQVDQDTAFEIGSVTKGLTGLLLADQVHAGRTSLEAPFGRARLEDLATHSAGLPRLPTGTVLRALPAAVSGGDPYRGTAEQVLAQARGAGPRSGAGPRYSNLGAAAAGDLLAQDAGTTYPQLLRERVLSPLGMTGTVVVTDDTGLPGHRATGSTASGVPRAPWIASGWAPAGIGVWSTSADLAALVRALAAGTAPGQSAVVPRRDFTGGERIGLFWRTLSLRGQRVTFHNGESGGMSAFVGFAPDTGRGIVVLTNTAKNVDAEALRLLLSGAGR